MTDRIRLAGLRGTGHHGVFAEERSHGQEFSVDAELELDVSRAAATDDLRLSADYGALAGDLHAILTGPPVQLLETVAVRMAAACLTRPRVRAATVTVHKPQAPIPLPFADVAVSVRRVAACLALGSNLGDRLEHLRGGLASLRAELPVLAVSPVYETAPVGGPEQGPYLNAVVLAAVPGPDEALAAARRAEAARGRTREVRHGPRTLDVDVITVGGCRSGEPDLTLPHPRAHERAFVLAPWRDLAPGAELPGHGSVADLLAARLAAGDRVERRDDLALA